MLTFLYIRLNKYTLKNIFLKAKASGPNSLGLNPGCLRTSFMTLGKLFNHHSPPINGVR